MHQLRQHGDARAHLSDVQLPGEEYLEHMCASARQVVEMCELLRIRHPGADPSGGGAEDRGAQLELVPHHHHPPIDGAWLLPEEV